MLIFKIENALITILGPSTKSAVGRQLKYATIEEPNNDNICH